MPGRRGGRFRTKWRFRPEFRSGVVARCDLRRGSGSAFVSTLVARRDRLGHSLPLAHRQSHQPGPTGSTQASPGGALRAHSLVRQRPHPRTHL